MFQETQYFRQTWLWLTLAAAGVLAGLMPVISRNWVLIGMVAALMLSTALLFYFARLNTWIEEDGLHIRFFPFHLSERVIEWDEIDSFQEEKYRPILEFGGWGIRWRPGRMAYNVSGNEGVRITRTDGTQLMIGSQKAGKLEEAIRERVEVGQDGES